MNPILWCAGNWNSVLLLIKLVNIFTNAGNSDAEAKPYAQENHNPLTYMLKTWINEKSLFSTNRVIYQKSTKIQKMYRKCEY